MLKACVALILCSAAMPILAQAPFIDVPDAPDTPAARRALEMFEAVSSGDPAKVRAFVQSAIAPEPGRELPVDEHVFTLLGVHRREAPLKRHGFRVYDPPRDRSQAVLVLWSEALQRWSAIVVRVEPEPPHRLVELGFSPARPPADAPQAGPVTEAEALAQIAAHVDRLATAGVFSGTVRIAKGDAVLYERAAGEAERSFHVRNDLATRFNLGSMNKMFTAVAIGQLVEEGKVSWDDPVSKWLGPEWMSKKAADGIRVRHLLSHTSGLGSYFNETFMRSSRALYRTLDDWRPLVAGETPEFEPGSRWAYSNTGFLLLGVIVEKAGGVDYFEAIRRRVYAPAGMTRSDCYDVDRPVENLAVGYSPAMPSPESGGTEWRSNVFEHVIRGGPAGGGYSTVADLHAFASALRAGKLLRPATLAVMWSAHPDEASPGYGYGFQVSPGTPRIVGHSGGFPGINSQLDIYPDSGWIVAVLSNTDDGASLVTARTRDLLARLAP